MKAAINQMQYPFLIAEVWNKRVSQGKLNREKFNFIKCDGVSGKSALHYYCETNSLGIINLILNQAPYLTLQFDERLKVPLEYKSKVYLISWKVLWSMMKLIYLLELQKPSDNLQIGLQQLAAAGQNHAKDLQARREQMASPILSKIATI